MKSYSSSSIASHLSAISFVHKFYEYADPCCSFIVQRALLGCKKLSCNADTRLPILLPDLEKLVSACTYLFNVYERLLYSAVLLIAYNGFFRIGELLPQSKTKTARVVQFHDVTFHKNTISIQLHFYKSRRTNRKQIISIAKQSSTHCPYKALDAYIQRRGLQCGPLFQSFDKSALTSSVFSQQFASLLKFVGLSPNDYKPHSLRIGACSQSIISGVPESTVMALGRWSSQTAFRRYIRIPAHFA